LPKWQQQGAKRKEHLTGTRQKRRLTCRTYALQNAFCRTTCRQSETARFAETSVEVIAVNHSPLQGKQRLSCQSVFELTRSAHWRACACSVMMLLLLLMYNSFSLLLLIVADLCLVLHKLLVQIAACCLAMLLCK
jgi:hypothetical protein